MLQHMRTDYSRNHELCWYEKNNISNLNKKTRLLKFEIYCMNQKMMKEYQYVKYCSKDDLWYKILKFYSIKKETTNSSK